MQGSRKFRRTAPTSARVGRLSPASIRLTNAFHCIFFWASSRNPSVRAKGTSSGNDVPRRVNENSIAFCGASSRTPKCLPYTRCRKSISFGCCGCRAEPSHGISRRSWLHAGTHELLVLPSGGVQERRRARVRDKRHRQNLYRPASEFELQPTRPDLTRTPSYSSSSLIRDPSIDFAVKDNSILLPNFADFPDQGFKFRDR